MLNLMNIQNILILTCLSALDFSYHLVHVPRAWKLRGLSWQEMGLVVQKGAGNQRFLNT